MAQQRERGWWYPYIFVAVFVVVVGVNVTMAYFATTTFTGISTDNAYVKGLAYNDNIAAAKAQFERGWVVVPVVTPLGPKENLTAEVVFTYRDRDGKALDGMTVKGRVTRPTTAHFDRAIVLKPLGEGRYSETVTLPMKGVWELNVVAAGDQGTHQMVDRFVLP